MHPSYQVLGPAPAHEGFTLVHAHIHSFGCCCIFILSEFIEGKKGLVERFQKGLVEIDKDLLT